MLHSNLCAQKHIILDSLGYPSSCVFTLIPHLQYELINCFGAEKDASAKGAKSGKGLNPIGKSKLSSFSNDSDRSSTYSLDDNSSAQLMEAATMGEEVLRPP